MPRLPIVTTPQSGPFQSYAVPNNLPTQVPYVDNSSGQLQALGQVSNTLNNIGMFVARYDQKRQEAQDFSDISNARMQAQTGIAEYMNGLQQNRDYKSYENGFGKLRQTLAKKLKDSDISPNARLRISAMYNEMFTRGQISVRHAAAREQNSQNRAAAIGRAETYIKQGDSDAAAMEYRGAAAAGLISHEEAQSRISAATRKIQFHHALNEIATGNPNDVLGRLDDGSSYSALDPADRIRLRNAAVQQQKADKQQYLDQLMSARFRGKLTLDMVRRAEARGAITAQAAIRLQNSLADPNQPKKFSAAKYQALDRARMDYLNGQISKADYLQIFEENSDKMPDRYTKAFYEILESDKKTDAPEKKHAYKQGMSYIKDLDRQGMFKYDASWFSGNKDKKSAEDQARYRQMMEANLHDFMKLNPEATPEQVTKFVDDATAKVRKDKITWDFAQVYSGRDKQRFAKPEKKKQSDTTVRRRVKGRVGIFNVKTQQFIRWE